MANFPIPGMAPQVKVSAADSLIKFQRLVEQGKDLTLEERRVIYEGAYNMLAIGDTSLQSFAVRAMKENRHVVLTTTNLKNIAAQNGDPNFIGDAYTVSIVVPSNPPMKPFPPLHVTFLDPKVLQSELGKAYVVMSHELLHMKRSEEGTTAKTRKQEEIAAFTAGIKLAESTAAKLRSMASPGDDLFPRVAGQIERQLIAEKAYLKAWQASK